MNHRPPPLPQTTILVSRVGMCRQRYHRGAGVGEGRRGSQSRRQTRGPIPASLPCTLRKGWLVAGLDPNGSSHFRYLQ